METLRWIVLALLVVPLAAAVVLAWARSRETARLVALLATLLNLVLTMVLVVGALPILKQRTGTPTTFQPILVPGAVSATSNRTTWDIFTLSVDPKAKPDAPRAAVQFYLGIDGLNLWLIALTTLLMVPAVLLSWDTVQNHARAYYVWLLLLNAATLGVFLTFDLVLFYVFFELTLIPLFFLVGIWGGSARREAARKLFLYTLAGSLVTLVGLVTIVLAVASRDGGYLTFSVPDLIDAIQQLQAEANASERAYWSSVQAFVFLTLVVGFAVKVPLVPVHTWLPLAYGEAPYPVTFLLSAVLAKMGTYGLLRLCLPLAPDAALAYGLPVLGTLGVIGIVYGALCAYAQSDLKQMIAYSSVSHLGVCVVGLVALNAPGLAGGYLQMVNHGIATGALFLLVGMIASRYGTEEIGEFSGLGSKFPTLFFLMVVICLASVGLPGLNNFVGELLVLAGVMDLGTSKQFYPGWPLAIGIALGIIFGAWYLMTMLQRVFFGPLKEPPVEGAAPTDLNFRELAAVVPLAVLCLVVGLFPRPILDSAAPDVAVVARLADGARQRAANPKAFPDIDEVAARDAREVQP